MDEFYAVCLFCLQQTPCNDVSSDNDMIQTFSLFKESRIQNNFICRVCHSNLESAYRFTRSANENNSKILDATLESDDEVCQTCLNPVITPQVYLYDHPSNVVPSSVIQKMLKYCLIDLDLDYRQNPVMCDLCWEVLKLSYRFLSRCAQAESKIKWFCKEQDISSLGIENLKQLSDCNVGFHRMCFDILPLDVCRNIADNRYSTVSDHMVNDIFSEIKVELEEQAMRETIKVEDDSEPEADQFTHNVTDRPPFVDVHGSPIMSDIVHVKIESNTNVYDINQCSEDPIALDNSEACSNATTENDKKLYIKLKQISLEKDLPEVRKRRTGDGAEDTQEKYKCHLCPYSSKKRYTYNHHLTTHMTLEECARKNMLFRCDQCSYRSKRKYGLAQHKWRIHRNSPLMSEQTPREAEEVGTLDDARGSLGSPEKKVRKTADRSDKIILKCSHCNFETKTYACLDEHAFTHKNTRTKKIYKCEVCGYEVKKKSGIVRHVIIHSTLRELSRCNKLYRCALCSFKTKRKDCLVPHMRKHKAVQVQSAGANCG